MAFRGCVMPAAVQKLRKRTDFLAASKAPRFSASGFILQIRDRKDCGSARIGFICSKKLGNAVIRNRAKRRLREIVRLELAPRACDGHDYVLIGRAGMTSIKPFAVLRADLKSILDKLSHPK